MDDVIALFAVDTRPWRRVFGTTYPRPSGQESRPSGVLAMSTAQSVDPSTGAEMSLRGLPFDFDQYDVRGEQQLRTLEENARWMRANPGAVLLIEGHADERGTNDYNLPLGERRAMSARNYLIAQGVSADRITTISYGEERPVCREHSESCWSRNRWAHFLVKVD